MDTPKRLLVAGSSGHARVALDAIERAGVHRVVGLIDSFRPAGEEEFGYRILGRESDLVAIAREQQVAACFVAVGDNWQRHLVMRQILDRLPQVEFPSVVHPSAAIARGVVLGRGSIIMPGAVVNAGARVGEFCIVNTLASLDHDARMDEYSSLAPGAITGGNVSIGAFTAVGIGASIAQRLTLGAHSVVGAGAVVLHDIPERCVAYGVPARRIRSREAGESYL